MKIFHLVKIRFDRRTAAATQEWLDNRYKFFAENTLKSLQAQTFKDWVLWINCQDGMQDMIGGLVDICPSGTLFTFGDGAPTHCERIQGTHVYVTRIDSDDLFSSDAMEIINNTRPHGSAMPSPRSGRLPTVEAAVFRRGYMHDPRSGRVGVYTNPSSPFHTIMFPREVFVDPEKYEIVWHKTGDHSIVGRHLYCHVLPYWKFCVLIHGNNFLSDFDYSREKAHPVEKYWSVERFMRQPVVFDVDDFCDQHNCLEELGELKAVYPGFKCTLFTIPAMTSPSLLRRVEQFNAIYGQRWIELGVHGITHVPNEELSRMSGPQLLTHLQSLPHNVYAPVFRPPGWAINEEHVVACNQHGLAVALHTRDQGRLGALCQHGHYICDDHKNYWHGHTHNVCGNWLKKWLPDLKTKWPKDQPFSFVSDSVLSANAEGVLVAQK